MPKARCKGRKAPKSAVNATSPPSDQVKNELGETSWMTCVAPVANMGINVHGKEEDMTLNEGSEPTILTDTSSSTESTELVDPDASYPEPTSCESRTIQHGLPFYDSPSPIRHNSSVQENWTLQSADLGQDPAMFTHPRLFGSVATPSGAQISLPLQGQNHFGPSSMSFPSQDFVRGQYDHESTIANGMGSDGPFTCDLPARPVAPKVENIRYSTFAASSNGLAGLCLSDFESSSWQSDDPWHTEAEPSIYTADADPSSSLLPSTYGSFSSYSDATYSSGLPLDIWSNGTQSSTPQYHQGLDEGLQQRGNIQAHGIAPHQPANVNAPSAGNPDLAIQSFNTAVFPNYPQA